MYQFVMQINFGCLIFAILQLSAAGSSYRSGFRTGNSNEGESTALARNRSPKFLNLFTVYRFPNDPCAISGSTKTGVCLTSDECKAKNGSSNGQCAGTYGVCCLVTLTQCGQSSSDNVTLWTNPGGNGGYNQQQTCSITVRKTQPDICQFRVDLLNFKTQAPTIGDCNMDRFTVSGQDVNSYAPTLCGTNTGQHFYVGVGSSQGPLIFNMITSGSFSRTWEIQISQIKCGSVTAAPQGCLQFYQGAAGIIQSFNYVDSTGTYLNNQQYLICFRKELGFCSFTLEQMDLTNTPFEIDGANTLNNAGFGDTDCPNDYLVVHNERICGDRFTDIIPKTDSAPVTDRTNGPFMVAFNSDGTLAGRGFQLNVRQNPCGFTGK